MSPLHSPGSPKPSAGKKFQMAHRQALRLHASFFRQIGNFFCVVRSCNQFLAENQKPLPHPSLLDDPQEGGNAMSPHILQFHNAKHREKIRNGYLNPAFSGAEKRADMLCHPCILGGPQSQARGRNSKWPIGGHFAYTPAFSVKLVIFSVW